jgi:hypothetical protein
VFLQLGHTERAKIHSQQLLRQREENKQREKEERLKMLKIANREDFKADTAFEETDRASITAKINKAAEGFDKSHPAAPSLSAFDADIMTAGIFHENLRRVFGITTTPKEMGALLTMFETSADGHIKCGNFLIKFLQIGKAIRDEKHKIFLEKQRLAIKAAKKEHQDKIDAQFAKAELKVDFNFSAQDLTNAFEKMKDAAFKFDKSHPSAPSTVGELSQTELAAAFVGLHRFGVYVPLFSCPQGNVMY